ncbi:outer membrane beta-barrel protein [uncultured Bacteroides sp.]|uniref:outer membrane beta-barrel protein n=1 Tax=uncultured Bacteroides sp. TaxID=162156 RepID=UPI0025D5F154|nr:outer membrane beta-barrel protein [uncultured Bacteroides sp.]
MKKLALALCLLAVSFAARAQFEKGTTIINPSLSGLNFSYNGDNKAQFAVGAQVGTFFADGIALMVNAGADWSRQVNEYTVGSGVRFYFNKTGIYLGGGLDWNRFRWSNKHRETDWGLGIEAGYAYFLSRTVTVEPAVYYKWRFNDGDMSRFGIKIGFGFYF